MNCIKFGIGYIIKPLGIPLDLSVHRSPSPTHTDPPTQIQITPYTPTHAHTHTMEEFHLPALPWLSSEPTCAGTETCRQSECVEEVQRLSPPSYTPLQWPPPPQPLTSWPPPPQPLISCPPPPQPLTSLPSLSLASHLLPSLSLAGHLLPSLSLAGPHCTPPHLPPSHPSIPPYLQVTPAVIISHRISTHVIKFCMKGILPVLSGFELLNLSTCKDRH